MAGIEKETQEVGRPKCFWCPSPASDPNLTYRLFGKTFAVCPQCAQLGVGGLRLFAYLVRNWGAKGTRHV
jgi:uncharacterized membrane protein